MLMMIGLAALASLAVVAVGASLAALRNDGYRPVPTDPARLR